MILVADAGSTKSSWALLAGEEPSYLETPGINPVHYDKATIREKITREFPDDFPYNDVQHVYYFGAGCEGDGATRMKTIMQELFSNASDVNADTDMMGAAVALCRDAPGIACILGTGSNSCKYDGNKIVENVSAGGYILGDEGSGTHMGKRLLMDFLRNKTPQELQDELKDSYHLTEDFIIQNTYRGDSPAAFLASFSRFLYGHINNAYCREIVKDSFTAFTENHILQYSGSTEVPIHFTGSLAYYFQDILKEVLQKKGCRIGDIIRHPIGALADYYQQNQQDGA